MLHGYYTSTSAHAVVLNLGVAAISALGLSQARIWHIAAKASMRLSKFDNIFERQALEHHFFNVYDELWILLHQPTETPDPRERKCSILQTILLQAALGAPCIEPRR